MHRSGPLHGRADGRLLAAVCLALVLLLAANPVVLLLPAEQSGATVDSATTGHLVTQGVCSEQCYVPGGLSVASIFPLGSDRRTPDRSDPEVVGLADDRAGELFDVLASGTARTLLQELVEQPQTASELAERVDTSLQNVHYHLENLHEAGAIAELDVEYSERGREMSVYTATRHPQVLVFDGQ